MKKFYFAYFIIISLFCSFVKYNTPFIGDEQVRTVQCYPNPATSYVNFEFPSNTEKSSYTISVYSFIGKKMSELSVNATRLTVTLENYTRGLYVFQLKDRNGQIIESGKFQVVK
ncbi:MAG: T9SS type A sorting domain-containing protein [Sphingobacteriia bacterium]|nr:T9SS type A sorting domain-containing protein [Sphingobacteriia bacterium]